MAFVLSCKMCIYFAIMIMLQNEGIDKSWSPNYVHRIFTAHAMLSATWSMSNPAIMMRSRDISLKSNLWHFQFWIRLKSSFGEIHFVENPTWIGQSYEQWKILQTIEIKRNSFLLWLHLTINAPDFPDSTLHAFSSI